MTTTNEAVLAAIGKNQLTRGLSRAQIQEFFAIGKALKAASETVFITEGNRNKSIYLLLDGELEVYLPDSETRFSKIKLARRLPGEYVGEYSFLDASPASASVKTTKESVLFQMAHENVEQLFESSPEIGRIVYRILLVSLVNRLRESDQELDLIQPFT